MDKYEISIWEDYSDVTSDGKSFLNERKIAVIGSDTMEAQARALEPNLVEDINGTHTFTFKMYYTYVDNETGEKYANPFGKYLINERKVKVFWKNQWYDLVIKKCQEDTSGKVVTYTCTDLFINELSKQGYSLEFDTELQNNIGTAEELAIAVLDGSTWMYDSENGTPITQKTESAVYETTVTTSSFWAMRSSPSGDVSFEIPVQANILVFYDSLVGCFDGAKNKIIQFLYAPEEYITGVNDTLVINGDCYYITADCQRNGPYIDIVTTDANHLKRFSINLNDGVSERYRATRFVRTQISEYDPLLDRYVLLCKDNNGEEIYKLTTTEYSNPLAVINLIANPTEFTSIEGWIGDNIKEFGLYPKFGHETVISSYNTKSYLKIEKGIAYNTGIQSNVPYFTPTDIEVQKGIIGGIQKQEKYVFRFKAIFNINNPESYILNKAITLNVCKIGKNNIPQGDSIFSFLDSSVNDNWVEFTLIANQSVSASEINGYGLFVNSADTYWIEDIQFFKYVEGVMSYNEEVQPQRMNPGEISLQSYVQPIYKYYKKNNNAEKADQLTYLYVGEEENSDYKPVYNNYEKIGTITEKESNRFNILQSIAETFQAWVKFRIEHEENGAIKFIDGIPQKFVYFIEEIGEETGISFEYGIDLKTISRTIDSDKLATKVIVKANSNEFAQNGFCTIARSQQSYTKENFILNLDYYTQQNLLDKVTLEKDLYSTQEGYIGYYYWLHKYNKEYDDISDELIIKNLDLTRQNAQKEIYEQYLLAAQQQLQIIQSDLTVLAGSQWADVEDYARTHISNEKVQSLLNAYGQVKNEIENQQELLEEIIRTINILQEHIDAQKARQQELLNLLAKKHKEFNDKYSTYLMEGTWQDEDYIDDDEYFLDGLNVAYTSSRPQLSYTINVLRLSSLEEFSSKIFHLGDICYMQDREFFGYLPDKITPYKEKILVSKISSFFDQPEKDVLTIQNYKTRFDDLFQRIAATTQSLQYSEGSFARAAGLINPDKTLSFAALQDTFDSNYNLVLNSSNQDVTWDETGITVTNKFNSADKTKILAGGIFVTNDGGETWKNAIRGDGISTNLLTAGRINTSEIYVYDGNAPSFRWDSDGITAYSYNSDGSIDFGKFVRHDKYGIYGYDGLEDFVPTSISQIKEKSCFGLTWDGFFLKSNGNGGTFEISTDRDLVVTDAEGRERIQLGRLDETGDEYGIIIKNSSLATIFAVKDQTAEIAGWAMTPTSIEKNGVGLYSTPVNDYYIKAGSNFGVKADGSMFASAGTIGGWTITADSIESINSLNKNQYTKIHSNGELEGKIDNNTSWSISRNGFQFLDLNGSQAKDSTGNQIILGNTKITNNTLYTSSINASGGSIGGCSIGSSSISGTGWSLSSTGITIGGVTLPSSGVLWDTIKYVVGLGSMTTLASSSFYIPTEISSLEGGGYSITSYTTMSSIVNRLNPTGKSATVLRTTESNADIK